MSCSLDRTLKIWNHDTDGLFNYEKKTDAKKQPICFKYLKNDFFVYGCEKGKHRSCDNNNIVLCNINDNTEKSLIGEAHLIVYSEASGIMLTSCSSSNEIRVFQVDETF